MRLTQTWETFKGADFHRYSNILRPQISLESQTSGTCFAWFPTSTLIKASFLRKSYNRTIFGGYCKHCNDIAAFLDPHLTDWLVSLLYPSLLPSPPPPSPVPSIPQYPLSSVSSGRANGRAVLSGVGNYNIMPLFHLCWRRYCRE